MELKFLLTSIPFLGVLLFKYNRLYEYYKRRVEINDGLSLTERDEMIQQYVGWTLIVGSIFVVVAYSVGVRCLPFVNLFTIFITEVIFDVGIG